MSNLVNDLCCIFCNIKLDNIFIRCADCVALSHCKLYPYICLSCFSSGIQNEYHRNDHAYSVINTKHFKTFDDWSIYEENEVLTNLENNKLANFKRYSYNDLVYDDNGNQLYPIKSNTDDWVKHLEKWVGLIQGDKLKTHKWKIYEDRIKTTMVNYKNSNQNLSNNLLNNKNVTSSNLLSLIRPSIDSKQYRTMSGYKPARGDFETEYNDKFEFKYLADLGFEINLNKNVSDEEEIDIEGGSMDSECFVEDNQLENELKLSILKSYNDLIRDRYEKKLFLRKFGMLSELSQNDFALSIVKNKPVQYDFCKKNQSSIIGDNFYHLKQIADKNSSLIAPKFQKLFKNFDSYTQLIELLNYQVYLKKKLDDLIEYRSNGIKKFRNLSIYKNLKFKRLNKVTSVHMASLMTSINRYDEHSICNKLTKSQCLEWFKKFVISEKNLQDKKNLNVLTTGRQISDSPSAYPASHLKYKNNPLKIENYPDCDKLDEEEKEFCRVARVQPTIFLRVKAILILENNKMGFCTYSKARKIAGIDVNKTRLIHNLLLKLELIRANAPSDFEKIET
ncbi:unnamed protein product [Brachionus calyciflorus]|uniref:SWIRM domain-containing protein n=1 Tax=Brachionus calyciflorus TaxID=104777 RepID=A0A813RTH5_9BILA|nr:unnamed protein product [Brachionus calyciflorus]